MECHCRSCFFHVAYLFHLFHISHFSRFSRFSHVSHLFHVTGWLHTAFMLGVSFVLVTCRILGFTLKISLVLYRIPAHVC